MAWWKVAQEGFSAVKSIDKLVTGIIGIFTRRKAKTKEEQLFNAKHKTKNYFDKRRADGDD